MGMDISFKKINRLAIPALISGVAEPLLSTTDLAIIGNVKDHPTESIAAIGIVGSFLSMLIWVLGQTRSGLSSIISQYLGANKLGDIKNLPAQAITIVVSIGILICALSYPMARSIFELYNAKGLILDYSVSYFHIRAFGFPFTLFTIGVFGVFRGLQNTSYPMLIAITGTIINILLDLILVYGIEGVVPAMHIQGAALASVVAQIIMAAMAFILIVKKTTIPFRIQFPINKELTNFISMVLNLFVRTIALNIALYLATSYATDFGKNYIAAYTIGLNLWLIGAFMIDGYSSAGNILAGKLLGAKEYHQLALLGKKLIRYGFVFGLSLGLIGLLFYYPIGRIFTQDDATLLQFYNSFWIILLMQPLCSLAFIFDGIFKGMGKMKLLRNVLLIATFFAFIPTLLLLDYYEYKLTAIWFAYLVWIAARGIPLILIFRNKFVLSKEKP